MRVIRASELVTYVYCHRAWWYQSENIPSANVAWLEAGHAMHERHGRQVIVSGLMRLIGFGLILTGLAVAAAVLVSGWLG
ncbi:MAG: hypothetical protein WBZ24_11645 [Anaerolineales bacterium]|jgi:CRISPR/Cas system-associated exonuclease Cas4 (RecB family)